MLNLNYGNVVSSLVLITFSTINYGNVDISLVFIAFVEVQKKYITKDLKIKAKNVFVVDAANLAMDQTNGFYSCQKLYNF